MFSISKVLGLSKKTAGVVTGSIAGASEKIIEATELASGLYERLNDEKFISGAALSDLSQIHRTQDAQLSELFTCSQDLAIGYPEMSIRITQIFSELSKCNTALFFLIEPKDPPAGPTSSSGSGKPVNQLLRGENRVG